MGAGCTSIKYQGLPRGLEQGHDGGGGCSSEVVGQQAPEQSTTRNRSPGQVSFVIKSKAVLLQMLNFALPGV